MMNQAALLSQLTSYGDVSSSDECCLAYAQLAVTAAQRQGFAVGEQVLAVAGGRWGWLLQVATG